MKDLAIDVFQSAKQTIHPSKRKNCFELFGFDFMIDEDFRTWLIEVNTNPYIGLHNKSMKHIVPQMFRDLFKIVLDPVFMEQTYPKPEDLTDFDLLYSRNRNINKRRPPTEGIYPIKELDQRKKFKIKFKYNQHNREKFVEKVNLEINTNPVLDQNSLRPVRQKNQSMPGTKTNSQSKHKVNMFKDNQYKSVVKSNN